MAVVSVRMADEQIAWIDKQARRGKKNMSRSEVINEIIAEKRMEGKMVTIINVDKRKALIAGKSQGGKVRMSFNPKDLTPIQRRELSLDMNGEDFDTTGPFWVEGERKVPIEGVTEATIETLRQVLDQKLELRGKYYRKLCKRIIQKEKKNYFPNDNDWAYLQEFCEKDDVEEVRKIVDKQETEALFS